MKQTLLLITALVLAAPAFGQGSPGGTPGGAPGGAAAKVPEYLGFYALNIPGFVWEPGAQVTAEYQRYTGTLNLEHTAKPTFVTGHRDPIPLTLDQVSRLLLGNDLSQPFDLVGLEVHGTSPAGDRRAFVVFTAVVGDKQVNLVPSLSTKAASDDRAGRGQGGPSFSGGPGGVSGRF